MKYFHKGEKGYNKYYKVKHIYLCEASNGEQVFLITNQRPYYVRKNRGGYRFNMLVVNDGYGNEYEFIDKFTQKQLNEYKQEEKRIWGAFLTEVQIV